MNTFSQLNYAATTGGWNLGASYDYKLRAYNSKGAGAWSTVLTIVAPGYPAKMTTLQCTSRSLTSMNFAWTDLLTDAETGKATILNYRLWYRLSTSTNDLDWVTLAGSSGTNLLTTFS